MKYYEVRITKTARPMGNNVEWSTYDRTTDQFETLEEAKEWLADQYYYCKTKQRTYIDGKNGKPEHAGWIYSFKSDPASYDDCKHYEQHWISIYELNARLVDF